MIKDGLDTLPCTGYAYDTSVFESTVGSQVSEILLDIIELFRKTSTPYSVPGKTWGVNEVNIIHHRSKVFPNLKDEDKIVKVWTKRVLEDVY